MECGKEITITYYNKRRWVESDRTDTTFRKTRKTRAYIRPQEDWIALQVPVIVDQETFELVQEQLKKNKAFSPRNLKREGEYLLRCLVGCGVCGRTMVAHSHGRHTSYHCAGSVDHIAAGNPVRCPAPQVFTPDLDHLVWQEIKALLSSPQLIRQPWENQHGCHEHQSADVVEIELTRLDQQIRDARRQIQRLVDGYQADLVRAAELSTRRASLEKSISYWSAKKSSLEAESPKWREIQKAWSSVDSFCHHALAPRGGWDLGGSWVPVPFVDQRCAELLFRKKVLELLKDEGLLSEEREQLLLSWRHQTGFSVDASVKVEPEDSAAVQRLARYILRPPVSLERMVFDEGSDKVVYTRKAKDGEPGGSEHIDAEGFLARLIAYIPQPRLHTVFLSAVACLNHVA